MPYRKPRPDKKHLNFQELYGPEDLKVVDECSADSPTFAPRLFPVALFGRNEIRTIYKPLHVGNLKTDPITITYQTLRLVYAREVLLAAVSIAQESFSSSPFLHLLPHWVDRDDSFRKLVNDDRFTPELLKKFWRLLEDIADSGNLKVAEGFLLSNRESDSLYWTKEIVAATITVHADDADDVEKLVTNVQDYPFSREPRSYCWSEIKDLFREVTLAQRAWKHQNGTAFLSRRNAHRAARPERQLENSLLMDRLSQ